ncbi:MULTISPECIES: glycosyltransferase [Peptostreptococcaceae]|uniref:glycosyltransferase n=1 Tax=Peptostreptococcaceae TaxID=186804 RepID=UPI003F385F52
MLYKREQDLVSVVVTNYNNGKYIEDCLDSILNQSYKKIEVILVNDASTDNSIEIINSWIKDNIKGFNREEYITVVNIPRNMGFSGAVSTGLFMTRGEFVAFHDGDDISNEYRIEKQVEFLRKHKNINSVGSNYAVFNNEDSTPVLKPNGIAFGVDKIKDIYYQGGNCVCYGTLMIRGEVFDNIGGLSRRLNLVEDYEYITKLLPLGLDNINEVLYYYRVHEKQRSLGLKKSNKDKIDLEKMNVLLVLDRLNIGGTETHVLSLATELINKGVNVIIMADKGGLSEAFEKLECKIYNVSFPFSIIKDTKTKKRYLDRIKQIIKKEKINIAHIHQSPSGALCLEVCKELGIGCVATIHGLYYLDLVNTNLKLADEVISVSHPVCEWLMKSNIHSTVIPNSIDFEKYLCSECNTNIRNELNIGEDDLIILYCSRLAWGKTTVAENLIRVCRDLKRLEEMKIHLLVVGDGPDFAKIVNSAKRANEILKEEYIHVVGAKTDLNDYYLTCDCVVGTGRVAIEALAYQKPIIASGNHGYFGILDEDNVDKSWSVYFGDHQSSKINNPSYLYKDIKYIYENKDKLKNSSLTCNVWARNKFDIKITIEQVINIYKNILDK